MKNILLLCSLGVFLVACGPQEQNVEEDAAELAKKMQGHHEQKLHRPAVDSSLIGVINSEDATDIFNAYLPVKDALVASDPEKTSAAAAALSEVIPDSENSVLHQLLIETQVLAKESDLETQRKTFEHVSTHLTSLLNANPPVNGAIYQFCPMAFNDKGAYWLSDSKKIMNPYFGDEMLHCGNVEAEIR